MAFNMFPYTNMENLNFDWIFKKIKAIDEHAQLVVITGTPTTNYNLTDLRAILREGNAPAIMIEGRLYYLAADLNNAMRFVNLSDNAINRITVYADNTVYTSTPLVTNVPSIADVEPVNVLLLGVDNTGMEDCSEIINNNTGLFELYFPSGRYRVDSPLYIDKAVHGAGASRQFTSNPRQGAIIVSNLQNESLRGVLNIDDRGTTIEGLHIICNEQEYGIAVTPRNAAGAQSSTIKGCTISNVSSIGIYLNAPVRSSRALYVHDCAIFGHKGALSTGIHFDHASRTPDCMIDSCEIMSVQKGIVNGSAHTRISNTHIWTGRLDDSSDYPVNWWAGTVGLDCLNSCQVDNCYFDTSHTQIQLQTDQKVQLYNCTYWDDLTGDSADAYVFNRTDALVWTNIKLNVDGAFIRCGDNYNLCPSQIIANRDITFHNITVRGWTRPSPRIAVYPRVGVNFSKAQSGINNPAGEYTEIAFFDSRYGGNCKITAHWDNVDTDIIWTKTGNSLHKVDRGSPVQVFSKQIIREEDSTVEGTKIYIYNPDSSARFYHIDYEAYGNAFNVVYNNMAPTGGIYLPESLSSADGLTEITTA